MDSYRGFLTSACDGTLWPWQTKTGCSKACINYSFKNSFMYVCTEKFHYVLVDAHHTYIYLCLLFLITKRFLSDILHLLFVLRCAILLIFQECIPLHNFEQKKVNWAAIQEGPRHRSATIESKWRNTHKKYSNPIGSYLEPFPLFFAACRRILKQMKREKGGYLFQLKSHGRRRNTCAT